MDELSKDEVRKFLKYQKIHSFLWGAVGVLAIMNLLYAYDSIKLQSEVKSSADTMTMVCEAERGYSSEDIVVGDTIRIEPRPRPTDPRSRSTQL